MDGGRRRAGAQESPVLWKIVLDDALGPVPGVAKAGVRCPVATSRRYHTSEKVTHLAYADDRLLIAKSAREVQHMVSMVRSAVSAKRLLVQDEKLAL